MSKDELDSFEDQMHQTLDNLNLDPESVEMMRALWLQLIEAERRALNFH